MKKGNLTNHVLFQLWHIKSAQGLSSKSETCCSPDDCNKVICKTPSSSSAWLEIGSGCPTYRSQLVFYHSRTTTNPHSSVQSTKAHFSCLRQKDHHLSKSWSPLRWGHQVLAPDYVLLNSEYPQGWSPHYISGQGIPVFSPPTPGNRSAQAQLNHLPG